MSRQAASSLDVALRSISSFSASSYRHSVSRVACVFQRTAWSYGRDRVASASDTCDYFQTFMFITIPNHHVAPQLITTMQSFESATIHLLGHPCCDRLNFKTFPSVHRLFFSAFARSRIRRTVLQHNGSRRQSRHEMFDNSSCLQRLHGIDRTWIWQ